MIDRIEAKPTSIEREIFPLMAKDGALYQLSLPGYWMDIGQPKDYISGQSLYLKAQSEKPGQILKVGQNIQGHVWVHASAKVDPTAVLGTNVVIGENCIIGPGCRIYNSTILGGTVIDGYSLI
mmetsp:Transcript_31793/g.31081  ORF Transcript_31793/g.31081 Transcript_31793/m.31081 type:complete len:123 (-) Transcript_31793:205-573(-)